MNENGNETWTTGIPGTDDNLARFEGGDADPDANAHANGSKIDEVSALRARPPIGTDGPTFPILPRARPRGVKNTVLAAGL